VEQEQIEIISLVLQQGSAFAALVILNGFLLYFGRRVLVLLESDLKRRDKLYSRLIDIIDRCSGGEDT
jgi:hypothetical protein